MDETTIRRLHAAALCARDNAHAPYSGFHVGAALLLEDGAIVTGANLENASYGLSLCAEAAALATTNSSGRLSGVRALLVTGGPVAGDNDGRPVTPCGRCRQMLAEAAALAKCDLPVIATDLSGDHRIVLPVSNWLPHAFALETA